MATAGLGICYLPDFVVQQDINDGKLNTLLNDYQPAPLDMYAVYPSKTTLNTKVRVVIDFLKEVLDY